MGRLQLHDIACVRGGRTLFDGLSFALDGGGAALVSGANGVGKSSLLRLIAGLIAPHSGALEIDGAVALADDQLALDPELRLDAALGFWARIDGRDGAAVGDALQTLGIAHLAPVPVRILSTGQRKRAGLARVIASGAAIWLLDEPANGLDADALARVEAAMAAHRAAGGIIIAASHQPLGLPGATPVVLA